MIGRPILALAASMLLASCGGSGQGSGPTPGPVVAQSANCAVPGNFAASLDKVVSLTNAFRSQNGLSALAPDAALSQAAQNHACDMATTGNFSHTGTGGSEVGNRMEAAGYEWRFAAENIALGQPFAEGAFNGWKASTGHRKNMLNADASEIGMGVASGPTGTLYWVMVLGDPFAL